LIAPKTSTRARHRVATLFSAVLVFASGAVAVAWLAPWGIGEPGGTRVSGRPATVYRAAVEALAAAPGWLHTTVEWAANVAFLPLPLLLAGVWWSGRRNSPRPTAGALLTILGTAVAFLSCSGLKLLVHEERPCHDSSVPTLLACPAIGDWSFPSSNATIIGALAAGLALTVPRLLPLVLPLAVAMASLRVFAGLHYAHDVAAGLVLGGTVTAVVMLVAMPATVRLVDRFRRAGWSGPPGAPRRSRRLRAD